MKGIVSIFLVSMVLLINIGLTVSSHYCGGKVADSSISIGKSKVGCGMIHKSKSCEQEDSHDCIKKKNCCENQYIQLTIDDFDHGKTAMEPSLDLSFLAVFVTSFHKVFTLISDNQFEYLAYSPPLLFHDIAVVNQVFRL